MKLTIVTHNVIKGDGQGRVNYEIAQEAIRRGHHVTLLASEVALELQQSEHINWVAVTVKQWPTELLRNIIFALISANWLQKNRSRLDVIKVNGAITHAYGDVNAVHFVHSSWLKFTAHKTQSKSTKTTQPRRLLYDLYQWLYTVLNAHWEKQAFRRARVVVAVSSKVAEDLQAIGVAPQKIRVIVNGVDLQEFSPGNSDGLRPGVAHRSNWNLPTGVPLALFAGDIRISRKNLDTVLKALVQVPDLHLAVAGVTEGSPYLQLAEALGLHGRVHFLGLRHDVPKLMKAVDFLVFPSRYEPFGLVVIEAMASGLPVITTATTGAADLVTPESGIVLADSDDVEALAKAMLLLASDRHQRQTMGQAARAIAQQHSWEQMARKYVDLLETLTA